MMKRRHVIRNFVCWLVLTIPLVIFGCFGDDPLNVNFRQESALEGNQELDAGIVQIDVSTDGEAVCNPNMEPTWDDPVNDIMQAKCTGCHVETASYGSIQAWINSGELKIYFDMGSAHFLDVGQEYCLRWLEIGAPKSDCDVVF